jgi:YegS/Rv2252/BmrU family lipid kinase
MKRIHVIINPAAGQNVPVLSILNDVFQTANIDWDISITKKAGDGEKLTRQIRNAPHLSAIGVYGGDGTIAEVAHALRGTEIPLGILPGGTANVLALELGIPVDLTQAAKLLAGDGAAIRNLDMCLIRKPGYRAIRPRKSFLVRASIGLMAEMSSNADRQTKDRLGTLAYIVSGLQALRNPVTVKYRLELDDQKVSVEGVTCLIANSGNLALPGVSLSPANVSVSDGLLDVFVLRTTDVGAILSVAASVTALAEPGSELQHWQARKVTVSTSRKQFVDCDGDSSGSTPITVQVAPGSLKVIVPTGIAP